MTPLSPSSVFAAAAPAPPSATVVAISVPATLDEAIETYRALIEAGGPTAPEHDELLHAVFALVAAHGRNGGGAEGGGQPNAGSAVDRFWSALPQGYAEATLMGHVYRRPWGYAGDFEIIDAIHTRREHPEEHWATWDRFLQRQACSHAVRNRAALLPGWIDELAAERPAGTPLRVLSLGSGPGRDIRDALEARPGLDLRFEGIDWETAAVRHAAEVCAAHGDRARFLKADALRHRPEGRYDLVYSAGLFDYFSDRAFRRCLAHYWDCVAPGGMLAVGNFRWEKAAAEFMAFGHWRLQCRDADHLATLVREAGISPEALEIRREATGTNLFAVLKR